MHIHVQRGPKVTSLVECTSCGRCAQHLRRIRGCEARTRRESGAYGTQMLRGKFVYDVRRVARVHHANVTQTCREERATSREVTFGLLCKQHL
jgi:hypothetical protein